MRRINIVLYAGFGLLLVGGGVAGMFLPPENPAQVSHLARELGASGLLVGALCFWCIAHYDHRRGVHLSMLLYWIAMALIHWYEYWSGNRPAWSPLLNSAPGIIWLFMLLDRRRASAGSGQS